ncbi:MAG: ABC transporter permease [Deltaproteobacteria bacterium]|nr:ABC transporter permease [Deltaproteobacteria bacterium]
MIPWFFRLSLRHLQVHPGRTLLGILGIALGTAVYLSISLAAASALKSFSAGVSAVAGAAQWRVRSPGAPLPESLFQEVRRHPQVRAAAPVVESVVDLAGPAGGSLLLLGIDPFLEIPFRAYQFQEGEGLDQEALVSFLTEPRRILVSRPLAARLGLKKGDPLPVLVGARRETLTVAGTFSLPGGLYPLEGAVALMDLAHAQELLGRVGQLDYLDLLGTGPQTGDSLARDLPPGMEVVRPGALGRQMEGLVASYRLNLSVLSAIALFVGMFLIYQSVTLSVVRRRREIGLLRTLGMLPRQVLLLFLAEGVVSGIVGGALGLLLGVGLARAALGVMTQTLTSLYTPVEARELVIQAPLLLQAWLLAVAATLAAAWLPALEAARTRVRAVWHREDLEERLESKAGLIALAGLAALGLAGALSLIRIQGGPPLPGFAASFLILLAAALCTPWCARTLGRGAAPLLRRLLGPAGDLGCRYLAGSLSRSAVSVAALAAALGMLIAVAVMIGSFRQTVENWVHRSISGDIFFGPAVFSTAAYDHFLPPEILPRLRQDPEVADIYLYRCVRLPFRDRYVLVIGGSFEVLAKYGGLWFRQGQTDEIMARVGRAGEAPPAAPDGAQGVAVISEPLAETFGYREGDVLELPTPSGVKRLAIAGVFYDYRTDGPSVWMDIRQFRRFWQDEHLNAVRLYLKDKSRLAAFQTRLQETFGRQYRLLTLSHQQLKDGILEIFDQTFALTYALEGVAIVVALFGIITTFLVLILDRERELALLQALGASRRQILGMVLVESGLASLLSFLLGAVSGALLSLLLIFIINKQAFGWTIVFYWTPAIYLQTLALVLVLGLAAGAYPAWRALQPHLAAILKEE